jgi:hypothetical protein
MKRTLKAFLLLLLVLLACGCGREYRIRGRVTAREGILVGKIEQALEENLSNAEGEPVKNARVRIIYELDKDLKPVEGTTWQKTVNTDEQGFFELSDYSIPAERIQVGLEITADGCRPAYTVYWDEMKTEEIFLIVLSRE